MDAILVEKAEELARAIAGEARTIEDLNGVLRSLMKSALEQMLGSELRAPLKEEQAAAESGLLADPESVASAVPPPLRRSRNRRNGTTPKSVQGDLGLKIRGENTFFAAKCLKKQPPPGGGGMVKKEDGPVQTGRERSGRVATAGALKDCYGDSPSRVRLGRSSRSGGSATFTPCRLSNSRRSSSS